MTPSGPSAPTVPEHSVAPAHSSATAPLPIPPDPLIPERPVPPTPPAFNLDQLSSYPEARAIRAMINTLSSPTAFGGGVLEESPDPQTSGIYMEPWLGGPGNFPPPSWQSPTGERYYPLLFRFRNGAAGHNVGLLRASARRHTPEPEPGFPPNSLNWAYALTDLQREIDNYSANQG